MGLKFACRGRGRRREVSERTVRVTRCEDAGHESRAGRGHESRERTVRCFTEIHRNSRVAASASKARNRSPPGRVVVRRPLRWRKPRVLERCRRCRRKRRKKPIGPRAPAHAGLPGASWRRARARRARVPHVRGGAHVDPAPVRAVARRGGVRGEPRAPSHVLDPPDPDRRGKRVRGGPHGRWRARSGGCSSRAGCSSCYARRCWRARCSVRCGTPRGSSARATSCTCWGG